MVTAIAVVVFEREGERGIVHIISSLTEEVSLKASQICHS